MLHRNLNSLEVKQLASTLAKKASKKGYIVGLSGNLGAGKTTFAQAFAKSLGIKTLKSPTFIVSQCYPLGDRFLFHLDFYRLTHPDQLTPLGLDEILNGSNVVLIEWVDKFPKIAAQCDILINLKVKPDNKRDVTIKSN
jgi:tRNA threonylcarbamoyladenosine biosynthesis protein TsaE